MKVTEKQLSLFIQTLSYSNLETFHSKGLEWIINQINEKSSFFSELIGVCENNSHEKPIHLGTVSELKNHDLITVVWFSGEIHLVFWENKIKADFSNKPITAFKTNKTQHTHPDVYDLLNEYENTWNRGVSQPFWYQLRWLLWDTKEKQNLLNTIKKTLLSGYYSENKTLELWTNYKNNPLTIKTHWCVLSTYTKDELSLFHKLNWVGFNHDYCCPLDKPKLPKGDIELVSCVAKKLNKSHELSPYKFIQYPSEQGGLFNLFKNNNEVELKKENNLVYAYVGYLVNNLQNSQDIQEKRSEVELLTNLHSHLTTCVKYDLEFDWLVSGSEKSGGPLLNIYFNPKDYIHKIPEFKNVINHNKINELVDSPNKLNISPCRDYIRWAIQIQGGTVKLQFAHAAYHSVKLKKEKQETPNEYLEWVLSALSEKRGNTISIDVAKKLIASIINQDSDTFKVERVNKPNTKTGLSFTINENSPTKPKTLLMENPKSFYLIEALCNNIISYLKKQPSSPG